MSERTYESEVDMAAGDVGELKSGGIVGGQGFGVRRDGQECAS